MCGKLYLRGAAAGRAANTRRRIDGRPARCVRRFRGAIQEQAYQSAPAHLMADPAIDPTHTSRFRRAPVSALNSLMAQWN